MDSERAEQIRVLLRKEIDWAYLLRTARAHGMMPLLYWHLNATCPEAVPKATLDQLRDHFHANAQRNLFLTGELLKLLNLLEAHGIPACPLKGPVLATSIYGNLAFRPFSDLDILVHKHDVLKAKDLLISRGYWPQFQLTKAQEASFLQSGCELPFVHADGKISVDLHWGIAPQFFSFLLDAEHLWERLESLSLGGKQVLSLSPEDLLLFLCVHGSKHCWERLEWICDVAELLRIQPGINWGQIMEQASRLGSARMLFLGLFLANDLLGTALPEEVWQKIQADLAVRALAAQVRARLFQNTHDPLGIFARSLFHLRARERLQDRMRYCFGRVMIPSLGEWALLPLPTLLFPVYYLLRPIRLAGKYGLQPIRRICISKCRGPIHRTRTRA